VQKNNSGINHEQIPNMYEATVEGQESQGQDQVAGYIQESS